MLGDGWAKVILGSSQPSWLRCRDFRARADCAPLLDVEDMLRLAVPDAKCVYTYVQELYRSLVAKGLVKTKKR